MATGGRKQRAGSSRGWAEYHPLQLMSTRFGHTSHFVDEYRPLPQHIVPPPPRNLLGPASPMPLMGRTQLLESRGREVFKWVGRDETGQVGNHTKGINKVIARLRDTQTLLRAYPEVRPSESTKRSLATLTSAVDEYMDDIQHHKSDAVAEGGAAVHSGYELELCGVDSRDASTQVDEYQIANHFYADSVPSIYGMDICPLHTMCDFLQPRHLAALRAAAKTPTAVTINTAYGSNRLKAYTEKKKLDSAFRFDLHNMHSILCALHVMEGAVLEGPVGLTVIEGWGEGEWVPHMHLAKHHGWVKSLPLAIRAADVREATMMQPDYATFPRGVRQCFLFTHRLRKQDAGSLVVRAGRGVGGHRYTVGGRGLVDTSPFSGVTYALMQTLLRRIQESPPGIVAQMSRIPKTDPRFDWLTGILSKQDSIHKLPDYSDNLRDYTPIWGTTIYTTAAVGQSGGSRIITLSGVRPGDAFALQVRITRKTRTAVSIQLTTTEERQAGPVPYPLSVELTREMVGWELDWLLSHTDDEWGGLLMDV